MHFIYIRLRRDADDVRGVSDDSWNCLFGRSLDTIKSFDISLIRCIKAYISANSQTFMAFLVYVDHFQWDTLGTVSSFFPNIHFQLISS